MSLRKLAVLFVGLGVVFGLVGAGVAATFTDSATATLNVHVGTFKVGLYTDDSRCTGSGSPTIACTFDPILSAKPGADTFSFDLQLDGTMKKGQVTLTSTGDSLPTPFHDAFTGVGGITLGTPFFVMPVVQGLVGGVSWDELSNTNEGQTVSITYTATADSYY